MGGRRAVELVAWPVLALAAALGLGWACAAVAQDALGPSILADARRIGPITYILLIPFSVIPPDLVVGWTGGVVVGGLAWVLVLIVGARRVFPERRRGLPVLLCVVLAVAASSVGFRALAVSVDGALPATSVVVAVIAGSMFGAGLVFPLWAALPFVRRAWPAAGEPGSGPETVPVDGLAVLDSWKRRS